jgi:CRISPR system Cascade subunit CasD
MPNTLFLRLEGPMQSWGERAHWDIRDTALEPTKSGIVGLLGCALGISEDHDLVNLSREIRLGIRCDRPGKLITDYHTVNGGVLSAEGKVKLNASTHLPETVVSTRYYLSDASFLAAIHANPDCIDHLSKAVKSPVWPVFLGRKSCPPSRQIFEGVGDFENLEEALKFWPFTVSDREKANDDQADVVSIRAVIECNPGEGIMRRDEIASNQHRTFLPRYTRDLALEFTPVKEAV